MIQKIKCWLGFHEWYQDPAYQPSKAWTCKHYWRWSFNGRDES